MADGLRAAVEALGVASAVSVDGQLGLWEEPAIAGVVEPAKRGPGRPAGARNRRTEEWVSYILSRYRSPLVVLAELYSRTPQELAKECGLYEQVPTGKGTYEKRLATGEALRMQVAAAQALLPYLHSRMPAQVQLDTKSAGVILIGDLAGLAPGGDGVLTLELQNQALSGVVAAQSDDGQSDGHASTLIDHDNPEGAR